MDFSDRNRWTLRKLKALQRVAKSNKHGLRPFFAHPKAMIELRELIERLETAKRVEERAAAPTMRPSNVVPLHTRRAPATARVEGARIAAGGV